MLRHAFASAAIAVALSSVAAEATATAQRTFVASTGNDANPCSLVLPCRSFAAAVAQTNGEGEVIVLDSAGYGPVTITQSVSITAPAGVYAGITVPANGKGITITADPADTITLRGLTLVGSGPGVGISHVGGRKLTIDRCIIHGSPAENDVPGPGVRPGPGLRPPLPSFSGVEILGAVFFMIRDTVIESSDFGVQAFNSTGTVVGTIERSTIHDVGTGIYVISDANVSVDSSLISGGGNGSGIIATASADTAPIRVNISNTRIQRFTDGILGAGAFQFVRITAVESDLTQNTNAINSSGTATVSLSDVRVTQNQNGIEPTSTGVFTSGTNYFRDNVSDGPAMGGPVGIK